MVLSALLFLTSKFKYIPLSVTPKKNRAAMKPPKVVAIPIKVATIPHSNISVGNQNLGVVRLSTMLHGISNRTCSSTISTISLTAKTITHITDEINRQQEQVLVPRNVQRSRQPIQLRITDYILISLYLKNFPSQPPPSMVTTLTKKM